MAATLDEATLATGHGVYAVFRIYPGMKVLALAGHLERMRRSAALLGQPYPLGDSWLRARLRDASTAAGYTSARVRLTVPYDEPDSAIISIEPFTPLAADILARGVGVGVAQAHRDQPLAKDSRFVEKRGALREQAGGDAYEILLAGDDGSLLEGMSSNFYAVIDGVLRTAGEGVLEGIARRLVLQVAEEILPVSLNPVTLADIPALSEAMLTSASRGPVPIVTIGDQRVGDGAPGPVFRAIRAAYEQLESRLLEDL